MGGGVDGEVKGPWGTLILRRVDVVFGCTQAKFRTCREAVDVAGATDPRGCSHPTLWAAAEAAGTVVASHSIF